MRDDKEDKKPELPDALELLAVLSDGRFAAELSAEMAATSKACVRVNQPGATTITIKHVPEGGMMLLKPSIKSTRPSAKLDSTMTYVDDDGGCHRDNPRQLKLKHVGAERGSTLRAVARNAKPAAVTPIVNVSDDDTATTDDHEGA